MKSYLLLSFTTACCLLIAVALLNLWVDPYAVFRISEVKIERISRVNPGYAMRLTKPLQVEKVRPTAVILGSSRAGSVSTEQQVWGEEVGFNLSMPGVTLYEMKRLIEHTQAQRPLNKLVLALEYETFLMAEPKVGLGYAEARLDGGPDAVGSLTRAYQQAKDVSLLLWTWSSLGRTLRVMGLPTPEHRRIFSDGSWQNTAPSRGGKRAYIAAGRTYVRRLGLENDGVSENLAILEEILAFCHRRSIDTRIYFSPEHLFLLDLRHYLGKEEGWREFHWQVARINESVAGRFDAKPFPLLGFNHLEGVVDEQLHRRLGTGGDWFKDGIHFHRPLGDLLMNALWTAQGLSEFELLKGNIDAYLERVEEMRKRFSGQQHELVEDYRREILGTSGSGRV